MHFGKGIASFLLLFILFTFWKHFSYAQTSVFYRAINFNGPSLMIDGNTWDGSTAQNYSTNGTGFCNQWVGLVPITDSARTQMIQCSVQHWAHDIKVQSLPNSNYEVSLYVWQDWADANAQTSTISLEGSAVTTYNPGSQPGVWKKLGPFTVSISDGVLNVTSSGGQLDISGIEVWKSNTSSPNQLDVNGDGVVNVADLIAVIHDFLNVATNQTADVTRDGKVNGLDFAAEATGSIPQPSPTPSPVSTPTPQLTPRPSASVSTFPSPSSNSTGKLRWAPPTLTNPTTITVNNSTYALNLNDAVDYIITMPITAFPRELAILGGRNLIIKGGYITVNSDTSEVENPALLVKDDGGEMNGRIVHLEGLRLGGVYMTDGIHTAAPTAIIQVENIYIDPLWQKGDPDGSGSHSDCIQTWGGVKELRVDKLTCASSPYQGFYLQANWGQPHGNVIIQNVNIHGNSASRYLFWISSGTFDASKTVTVDNVWIQSASRTISGFVCFWKNNVCTNYLLVGTDSSGVRYATWPGATSPTIVGRLNEGNPPTGDFVPATAVGLNYQSLGYQ
jgi:hypothetical protein